MENKNNMQQQIFLREKGYFSFLLNGEKIDTYDPLIRVVQQGDKILAIQFQATFDYDGSRLVEKSNIYPDLELPPEEEDSGVSLDVYLNGNEMLRKHLASSLKEEPFMNPVEAVVYIDNVHFPILRDLKFYDLLDYKVGLLKRNGSSIEYIDLSI